MIARAQAKRIGENLVRSWCTWCYILLDVDEVFRKVIILGHHWQAFSSCTCDRRVVYVVQDYTGQRDYYYYYYYY